MKKISMIGVAVVACGLSVVCAGEASATQWLQGGESLTTAHSTDMDGVLRVTKSGGSLGSGTVECNIILVGTVGPGAVDRVNEITNLSEVEKNLVACTRLSGFCFSPVVHAEGLPWKTELALIFGVTWDYIESGGLQLVCAIGNVLCSGRVKVKFIKNTASGSEFEFDGAETGETSCSDGGIGTYTGKVTALGFTVS